MSHRPAFGNHLASLGCTVSRNNRVVPICRENPCQQLCVFSVTPSQRSSPQSISTASFPPTLRARSLPAKLSPSYFQRFPVLSCNMLAPSGDAHPKLFPMVPSVHAPFSLPPSAAPPKPFPCPSMLHARSLPATMKLFLQLPFHPCCFVCPPSGASAKLIPTLSNPCALHARFPPSGTIPKLLHSQSLPAELAPSCFHGPHARSPPARLSPSYFTISCPCRLLSFPPSGALPKLSTLSSSSAVLAPSVSCPSTLHAGSLSAQSIHAACLLSRKLFPTFPFCAH
jgi:hypothetical protein